MTDERTSEGLGAAPAEVSTALVGLHKRFCGKGPVRAKSFLIDGTMICILEGGFTVVERTLIEIGPDAMGRELRREFQAAMQESSVAVVEEHLQRKVIAYMSQVNTDPDVAVELFMLKPASGPEVAEVEQELPKD